jgi:hypothetical protein
MTINHINLPVLFWVRLNILWPFVFPNRLVAAQIPLATKRLKSPILYCSGTPARTTDGVDLMCFNIQMPIWDVRLQTDGMAALRSGVMRERMCHQPTNSRSFGRLPTSALIKRGARKRSFVCGRIPPRLPYAHEPEELCGRDFTKSSTG